MIAKLTSSSSIFLAGLLALTSCSAEEGEQGTTAAFLGGAIQSQTYGRVGQSCDRFVSTGGNDSSEGTSASTALRSIDTAVARQASGGTVCVLGGTYPKLKIADKNASAANPLVVRAAPGHEGDVLIRGAGYNDGFGVNVTNSSHVYIQGLDISNSQKGISFFSVTNGGMFDNNVHAVGMEALHAGATFNYGTRQFDNGPSSNIDIINNQVVGTGFLITNNSRNQYSEGVYIGTGSAGGDDTHDVLVQGNYLKDIQAEAIEVKPYTYNVDVIGNHINGVRLYYSGAITLAVATSSMRNGNYRVLNNFVENVRTDQHSIAGILVATGNAEVRGNHVRNVEGGRSIRVYTTFHNKDANDVLIADNRVDGQIALNDGDGGYGGRDNADITMVNNAQGVSVDGPPDAAELGASQPESPGAAEEGAGELSAPSGLRGQVYSSSAIEVFWDRSADSSVSEYEVIRNGDVVAVTDGVSHFDSALSPSTAYRYQVVAVNRDGTRSAPSSEWSGTTRD